MRSVEVAPHVPVETTFLVEASLDRAAWQTIARGEGKQHAYLLENFAGAVKARFIRIRFVEFPAQESASLGEVRVMAVPAN